MNPVVEFLEKRFGLLFTRQEAAILSSINVRRKDPKTVLLGCGEQEEYFYIVVSGMVRKYIPDTRQNATMQIAGNGSVVSSIRSLLTGQPSRYEIITVEETEILYCPKIILEENSQFTGIKKIADILVYEATKQYEELQEMRVRHSKFTERCLFFARSNEDVFLKGRQKHIAGMLGISPEAYNRLRIKVIKMLKKEKV